MEGCPTKHREGDRTQGHAQNHTDTKSHSINFADPALRVTQEALDVIKLFLRNNDCRMITQIELEIITCQQVKITTTHSSNGRTETSSQIELNDRSSCDIGTRHNNSLKGDIGAVISQVIGNLRSQLFDDLGNSGSPADKNNKVASAKFLAGDQDAGAALALKVGHTYPPLTPSKNLSRQDWAIHPNSNGVEASARKRWRVLLPQPLSRHRHGDDNDSNNHADGVAEGIANCCLRVTTDSRRCIQRRCSGQRTGVKPGDEAFAQSQEVASDRGHDCADDTDDRGRP